MNAKQKRTATHAIARLVILLALPILACSTTSRLAVLNHQARDVRLFQETASGPLNITTVQACSEAIGDVYIGGSNDIDRLRVKAESGEAVTEARVEQAEPYGGFAGGYEIRIRVPERRAGECESLQRVDFREP